jgi:mono/diheme cytochrome c family protein
MIRQVAAWSAVLLFPVVVLGGLLAARRDPTRPNHVLPTQMVSLPVPVRARPPVEGTLARGAHAFHYAATDAERQRAGRELVNPFHATPETLAAGKRAYEINCLVCHGAGGAGDGPIVPKFPNPPGFRAKKVQRLNDGEIFHTITVGRKKMAGHAALVSWDERWQIVLYIRSLQKGKS